MNAHSDIQFRIRLATDGDARALRRLGGLESRPVPPGRMLVAEIDGEVPAALPLDGGGALADPFRQTAHLVQALDAARAHVRGNRAKSGKLAAWGRALRRGAAAPRPAGGPVASGSETVLIR